MAHFYGNLKGSRGEATRCGNGALSASVRSWESSVTVAFVKSELEGHDVYEIRVADGSATGGRLVAAGYVSDLRDLTSFTFNGNSGRV